MTMDRTLPRPNILDPTFTLIHPYALPSKNFPTKSEGKRDLGSSISLKYCITCVLCLTSQLYKLK